MIKIFLGFFFIIMLVGCQNGDKVQVTKGLISKLHPLTAEDQAAAIKSCESNEGWTGTIITFNNIVLQVKCVKDEK